MPTSETRDPRAYRLERSGIDEATLDAFFELYHPEMQRIGRVLSSLGVLPLQEEPKGSGKLSTTGNFSLRAAHGIEGFVITGSAVDKCDLEEEGLAYVEHVDYDAGVMAVAGIPKPSREVLIHDQIYREFPWVNAVLHTHDELALRYDKRSRRTKEPIFFAHQEDARKVVAALRDANYVTLPEHGQFAIGESVDEALDLVKDHHLQAYRRTPLVRVVDYAVGTAMVGQAALVLAWVVAGIAFEFRAEEKRSDSSGTITYVLSRPVDEKSLNSWEGERQIRRPDGKWEVTYWAGGR